MPCTQIYIETAIRLLGPAPAYYVEDEPNNDLMTDDEFNRQGGSNYGRAWTEAQEIATALCIGERGAHIDLRLDRLAQVADALRPCYPVDDDDDWSIDLTPGRWFDGPLVATIEFLRGIAKVENNVVSFRRRAD